MATKNTTKKTASKSAPIKRKRTRIPADKKTSAKKTSTHEDKKLLPGVNIQGSLSLDPELLKEIGAEGLQAELVKVTPEMAENVLKYQNKRNRPLSTSHVKKLVREQYKGNWIFNADPVRFMDDANQNLMDGQHRLAKIIETGVPEVLLVVWGIPADAIDTIDNVGKNRTGGDVFFLHKKTDKYWNEQAAALRLLLAYEYGNPCRTQNFSFSNMDLNREYSKYPGLAESANFVVGMPQTLGAHSIRTVAHYIMARQDKEKADEFFTKIKTKIGFEEENDHALLTLNKLEAYHSQMAKTGKTLNFVILAYYLTGWNAMMEDRKITTRSFKSPMTNDRFPYAEHDWKDAQERLKSSQIYLTDLMMKVSPEARVAVNDVRGTVAKINFLESCYEREQELSDEDA